MKAARNSAIGCGILLAVIEGVGIGIQRMMAENTRLDVRLSPFLQNPSLAWMYAYFLKHGCYLPVDWANVLDISSPQTHNPIFTQQRTLHSSLFIIIFFRLKLY